MDRYREKRKGGRKRSAIISSVRDAKRKDFISSYFGHGRESAVCAELFGEIRGYEERNGELLVAKVRNGQRKMINAGEILINAEAASREIT